MSAFSRLPPNAVHPALAGMAKVQRKCSCDEKKQSDEECLTCNPSAAVLQRHQSCDSYSQDKGTLAPDSVSHVLKSTGRRLDNSIRAPFESYFQHDFSGVRIHSDKLAESSAESLNADAYTVGSHIVFNTNTFDPQSTSGAKLLAHELTHTIQQSGMSPSTGSIAMGESTASEREAENLSNAFIDNRPTSAPTAAHSLNIARKAKGTTLGTRNQNDSVPHKALTASFDGRSFRLFDASQEIFSVIASSGRFGDAEESDVRKCRGVEGEDYLNNPRYVGIKDKGPIPEGIFRFRPSNLTQFSGEESYELLGAGKAEFHDPHGKQLSGGDWGSGRVALEPVRVKPAPCGDAGSRSAFFLHGGILPGSAGCIDVGNSGFDEIASLVAGYKRPILLTVAYTETFGFSDLLWTGLRGVPGLASAGARATRDFIGGLFD